MSLDCRDRVAPSRHLRRACCSDFSASPALSIRRTLPALILPLSRCLAVGPRLCAGAGHPRRLSALLPARRPFRDRAIPRAHSVEPSRAIDFDRAVVLSPLSTFVRTPSIIPPGSSWACIHADRSRARRARPCLRARNDASICLSILARSRARAAWDSFARSDRPALLRAAFP